MRLDVHLSVRSFADGLRAALLCRCSVPAQRHPCGGNTVCTMPRALRPQLAGGCALQPAPHMRICWTAEPKGPQAMDPAQRPGAHQPPARQHRRGRRGAAAALRAVPAREVVPDLARAARMSSSGHCSSAEGAKANVYGQRYALQAQRGEARRRGGCTPRRARGRAQQQARAWHCRVIARPRGATRQARARASGKCTSGPSAWSYARMTRAASAGPSRFCALPRSQAR